jgi:ABC-type nitrate/sulfonate/bicarbonate transport system substrate-binding protein
MCIRVVEWYCITRGALRVSRPSTPMRVRVDLERWRPRRAHPLTALAAMGCPVRSLLCTEIRGFVLSAEHRIMSQRGVSDRSPVLWSRAEFLKATLVTMCAPVVVRLAQAADNPVVRIAASRGVVSAPIWNVSNHASRYGFSVEMSVLFTYADQQRAAQNTQTELATTGINNPAIIADQGITNLRYVAGQQFGGQNLILRKNVMAETWKALEGKTIGVVPGTYARVLFLVAAQEGGADLEKIKLVNVSVGATALEALRKGDVDGFVLFAPMTDQVVVEGTGYYPPKLDIGACSLGPANGGILASTDFLAEKTLALNFMKAYVASIREMQDETAFVKVAMQLAGISAAVAQESFRNLYFSEAIDVEAITAAAKLGSRFGFTKADVSDKVSGVLDFGPLISATGKTQAELTGTPPPAQKLVRR